MDGVWISTSGPRRAWALVSAPWSTEVLTALTDADVEGLTLAPTSEVREGGGLDGLDRLESLRALEVGWARVPPLPVATLRRVEELALTGTGGERIELADLAEVRSLELRPGRASGALSDVPHLEVLSTRGMPADGLASLDGCRSLTVVRMHGRGVTRPGWNDAPASVSSLVLSGIALDSLDGIGDLRDLNDLALETGRAARGLVLDLAPLARLPRLRVVTADGYAGYRNVDVARGAVQTVRLGPAPA